jgi:gas vesicle protein
MADLKNTLSHSASLITGMVVGAAAMYILDPERGSQRRAVARDKLLHGLRQARTNANKQARNAWNNLYGSVAETRAKLHDAGAAIADDILEERVRAQIGHVVAHPGALDVRVEDGCAIISGPVLQDEIDKIEARLHETRGLWNWKLDVQAHESAENIPGLQGGAHEGGSRSARKLRGRDRIEDTA